MVNLIEVSLSDAPYPGLRPFHSGEADIFFGREEHTDLLLEKLQRSRFLAVVGPSGCGKSSLVRAGMIAALETGFMAEAGARWRVADMRPGDQPLTRLAEALLKPAALGAALAGVPDAAAFVLAMLRRGPLGLVETVRETGLPPGDNLLLLVDQFEEIFRFRQQVDADEADAFVDLLLETARQREVPVYVVITMRSDFLGDCALFSGLPEAINDSQFLTPRLTREQNGAAIVGPARVFGGDVDGTLLNTLLNDMGPDPDQLPLLQHALMRMWQRVNARPSVVAGGEQKMLMGDYEKVGGLTKALSDHANEVYEKLTPERQEIARVLFRCLTERGVGRRDTRRPARLSEVAAIAVAPPGEVMKVVEAFRHEGRNFVTPPPGITLRPETTLDIGHESLISKWTRLDKWADEEADSAVTYQRLKQTSQLWQRKKADLLGALELERALEWSKEHKSTRAWARRYGSREDFRLVVKFLRASRDHWKAIRRREQEELRSRQQAEIERQHALAQVKAAQVYKRLARVLAAVAAVAVIATVWAFMQSRFARAEGARATEQANIAESRRLDAERAGKEIEEKNAALASQVKLAVEATAKAKEQEGIAVTKTAEAVAAQSRLADALKKAQAETARANSEATRANNAAALAEKNRLEAVAAQNQLAGALATAQTESERANGEARKAREAEANLAVQLERANTEAEKARAAEREAQKRLDEITELEKQKATRLQAAQEATQLTERGVAYINNGQYAAAAKVLSEAVPLYRTTGNRTGEAQALLNIGVSYDSIDQPRQALDFFNKALPIFRELQDKSGEAVVLLNIGRDYQALGDHAKALEYLREALPRLQQAAREDVAAKKTFDYYAGLAKLSIGMLTRDVALLKEVESFFDEANYDADEVETLKQLGNVYRVLGDQKNAAKFAQQAREKQQNIERANKIKNQ